MIAEKNELLACTTLLALRTHTTGFWDLNFVREPLAAVFVCVYKLSPFPAHAGVNLPPCPPPPPLLPLPKVIRLVYLVFHVV